MSTKDREALEPVYDPKDVPEGLSDEEQIRFWETHSVTGEFLEKTEEVPEDELPRPRTRPINVRFDEFTLGRLKRWRTAGTWATRPSSRSSSWSASTKKCEKG